MSTKNYIKAKKFVDKVIELYHAMVDLHEAVTSHSIVNGNYGNYFDACIRTYGFKFNECLSVCNLNKQSAIYYELLMIGADKPLMARGGYKFNLRNKEIINEFSTVNNSEENEFQLSLIYTEHELFHKYVYENLRERLPEVSSVFLESLDVRRLIPAIKATKEITRGFYESSEFEQKHFKFIKR